MNEYWASRPKDEIVGAIEEKWNNFRKRLRETKKTAEIRMAWRQFMGRGAGDINTKMIMRRGKSGEIKALGTNHFSSIVRQICNIVTSHTPRAIVVAENTNSDTLIHASVGSSVIEHYDSNRKWRERDAEAVFNAVLMGEGFTSISWDGGILGDAGPGDVVYRAHTIFDVAYNFNANDFDSTEWVVIRTKANKWRIAARVQDEETREAVLGASIHVDAKNDSDEPWIEEASSVSDEDSVFVFEMRHPPSLALPNGRMVRVCAGKVIFDSSEIDVEGQLVDAGYPMGDDLGLFRVVPEVVPGTMDGHTETADNLGLQALIDVCLSSLTTTVNASGVANFYQPEGGGPVRGEQVSGAMRIIRGGQQSAPVALQGPQTSPVIKDAIALAVETMRSQSQLNDVVMGDVPNGMPAQGMALMQAAALQSKSRLQGAYYRMIEASRFSLLRLLAQFADDRQIEVITGSGGEWKVQSLKLGGLKAIKAVRCELVDPLTKSSQGRIAMADNLMSKGQIDAVQYISLIKTGSIDALTEKKEALASRIQRDKEKLRRGIGLPKINVPASMRGPNNKDGAIVWAEPVEGKVVVSATDPHWIDCEEFLAILDEPGARENEAVKLAVTEVVRLKLDMWENMDPLILQLRGGRPPPPRDETGLPMRPPPADRQSNPGIDERMSGPMPSKVALPKDPISGQQPMQPHPQ